MIETGTTVDRVVLEIEAGKIREFVRASAVVDAVHTDASIAARRGLPNVPATLTHSVAVGHLRDQAAFVAALGLDLRRIVVGEVGWEYRRPLVAGDRLDAHRTVVSDVVREGSSGRMRLVTLETALTDAAGDLAATVRETLIERGAP